MALMTRYSRRSKSRPQNEKIQRSTSQNSDIVWSGDAWICCKQLKHYPAFLMKNETNIPLYSFVWILGEEKEYIGYVDDLYEDQQRGKMVRVLKFLFRDDIQPLIPNLLPMSREVFITSDKEEITSKTNRWSSCGSYAHPLPQMR